MPYSIARVTGDYLYHARLYLYRTYGLMGKLGTMAGEDSELDAARILFECEASLLLESSQNY